MQPGEIQGSSQPSPLESDNDAPPTSDKPPLSEEGNKTSEQTDDNTDKDKVIGTDSKEVPLDPPEVPEVSTEDKPASDQVLTNKVHQPSSEDGAEGANVKDPSSGGLGENSEASMTADHGGSSLGVDDKNAMSEGFCEVDTQSKLIGESDNTQSNNLGEFDTESKDVKERESKNDFTSENVSCTQENHFFSSNFGSFEVFRVFHSR